MANPSRQGKEEFSSAGSDELRRLAERANAVAEKGMHQLEEEEGGYC